jgi:hypothetical protein
MWVYVGEQLDALCPSHALAMLHRALDSHSIKPMDFIFSSTKNKKWTRTNLTGNAFSKCVKFWVEKLRLDPKNYTGYSFRYGSTTALFHTGVAADLIQVQGRWYSNYYKYYIEMNPD